MRAREGKNITAKLLYVDPNSIIESHLTKSKFLPNGWEIPSATALVYGEKVALVFWSENQTITILTDKLLVDSYQKKFDDMWDRLPDLL